MAIRTYPIRITLSGATLPDIAEVADSVATSYYPPAGSDCIEVEDDGWSGWPNRATWLVHLWLSNDEWSWGTAVNVCREAWMPEGRTDDWRYETARLLRGHLDSWMEQAVGTLGGMWYDLLREAFRQVDFDSLADSLITATRGTL